MKRKGLNGKIGQVGPDKIARVLYATVIGITVLFLIGISISQNIDVYTVRPNADYAVVQETESRMVIDEDTPLGMKREYRWVQGAISPSENYLAFYVVHQYVEVYFDGELMYHLKLRDDNKVGKTTASNWIMIPLYPEDEGKEICVKITPAYEVVRNRPVNFYVGSKFRIYFDQLKNDLPQIILSLLAIGIGSIFIIISMFHKYRGKENANLTYLGIFSFAIGLWKLTDIRFASLMFPQNPLALSYISISMLVVGVAPWMLSIKKQFLKKSYSLLEWISVLACTTALIIMILQMANIADLRETLWITHIVVGVIVVTIVGAAIYEGKRVRITKKAKILYACLLLCAVGAILDLLVYYIQGNSSGILCALIAVLIYIITMGYISINEINQKANIDMHTGLFNKSRCNEILEENEVIQGPLGIIMFDLNGLKQANDLLGHETGDLLIAEFAHIVRSNIASRNFVGRYGGDEFIAVIKEENKQSIDQALHDIAQAVAKYNEKDSRIAISYASGYALDRDYPGCTLRELLKKADDNMYKDKKVAHDTMS